VLTIYQPIWPRQHVLLGRLAGPVQAGLRGSCHRKLPGPWAKSAASCPQLFLFGVGFNFLGGRVFTQEDNLYSFWAGLRVTPSFFSWKFKGIIYFTEINWVTYNITFSNLVPFGHFLTSLLCELGDTSRALPREFQQILKINLTVETKKSDCFAIFFANNTLHTWMPLAVENR
jgi:hypothetical protein